MISSLINHYKIKIWQNGAEIYLSNDVEGVVCTIYFKPDGSRLPPALLEGRKSISLFLNMSQYIAVTELLRFEKPLFIFYSHPGIAFISTQEPEPTGEQEGI